MSHSTRVWQPKALAETIDESFSKPLPYIDRKPGLGVRVATSSTHTLHQTPPMIWLDRNIADYATPAERALAEGRVQEVTIQNCMPALESTHKIECEPDVVRPSALYLLHPVHMALTALHPDVSIHCMSEPYDQNKIRPDVVYKKKGKIFAILEFKVPGSMAEEEFFSASMPWASSRTKIMEHKAKAPEVE
ncbi:hypothetical protein C8A01DRAFT_38274 [Parachaetomium inaequale]|uniref:Uncharacterized protein n=1 Tax=Parachaetomium inaequale TaxID=2588326 RepID=A0AAN6PFV9_9PEZI|nr:hypothetical protein C8A01DRAFT_38274 [Parachaetomium inaequale]